MKEIVVAHTESGSIYEIDLTDRKWYRVKASAGSVFRSEGGDIIVDPIIEIGKPLALVGKPMSEGTIARAVLTTLVVDIKREQRD